MPETVFIYALCEPHNENIRYIGKSVNPSMRLSQHIYDAYRKHSRTHLGCWIRSLNGKRPRVLLLAQTDPKFWQSEEIRITRDARKRGENLTNASDGGEGVTMTPEVRAKIRKSKLGARNPNYGKKLPLLTRTRMSLARRGVPLSKSHRAALSAGRKGIKFSPSHCAALKAAWVLRRTRRHVLS